MEIKLSNKDYIWSYIGIIVSAGSYLIMTPFALIYLTEDMYGLWGVFQSVSSITLLFDFGFSITFARNINYCWSGAKELKKTNVQFVDNGEPNYFLMKKTIAVCKHIFLVLSLVALILMVSVGTFYIAYICRMQESLTEPLIAWGFYAVAISLNLYYGYYNSFLRGVGAISDANKITSVSRIVQMILTVAFLYLGLGIIGTGIAYLIYGVIFRMYGKKAFYKFRGIGNSMAKIKVEVDKQDIKEIFSIVWFNAGREGLVTLANYLANQACTIICSLFLPLSVTGIYSLSVQVATAVSNVSGALYTANQPVLQTAYITGNKKKTKETMSLIIFSYVLLYMIGMLLAVTIGIPVIKKIKPQITLPIPILLGTGLYQFILKFRNCYTSYFSSTNRIPYVKAFLVSAFLCVMMAYAIMKWIPMGLWGLIVAQIISQGIYNAWHWMIEAHKEMQLSVEETIRLGYREMKKVVKGFLYRRKKNV